MKWTWLRALMLGLTIGPVSLLGDAAEADPVEIDLPASEGDGLPGIATSRRRDVLEASRQVDWAVDLPAFEGGELESGHWHGLAERNAALHPVLTSEDEAEIAAWVKAAGDESSAARLGFLLCLLPSLDRTCLISSWATSPDEEIRRALARALAAPFEAVGVRGVLDELQRDASPDVRQLAAAAAKGRGLTVA